MQLSQGTFERGPFFLLGGLKTDASLEWFNVFCCQDLFAPSFRKALSQKHWWQGTHSQGGCKGGTKVGQGHSNFWNNKKKCVFIKRFASAVLDSVLGHLHQARQKWQHPCFSVVPEATHEDRKRALDSLMRCFWNYRDTHKDTVRCAVLVPQDTVKNSWRKP